MHIFMHCSPTTLLRIMKFEAKFHLSLKASTHQHGYNCVDYFSALVFGFRKLWWLWSEKIFGGIYCGFKLPHYPPFGAKTPKIFPHTDKPEINFLIKSLRSRGRFDCDVTGELNWHWKRTFPMSGFFKTSRLYRCLKQNGMFSNWATFHPFSPPHFTLSYSCVSSQLNFFWNSRANFFPFISESFSLLSRKVSQHIFIVACNENFKFLSVVSILLSRFSFSFVLARKLPWKCLKHIIKLGCLKADGAGGKRKLKTLHT